MPHQCLKCGKVFPSGSPEILKGCGDCGGKKFFYTEEPVSEEEREELIEQANKDIKVLIREILSQSQRDKIKTYDSEGFAKRLENLFLANHQLTFLTGGPLGLHRDILAGVDEVVSLSSLTFTHEISRLLLLEQLYRAFTIMQGERYHK